MITALAASDPAQAQQLLFTTFGPSESYIGSLGGVIGGGELWLLSGNNGSIQEAAFTPSATAPFLRADLALLYNYVPSSSLIGPPDLDITLTTDNNDSPGGPLETFHLSNVFGGLQSPAILSVNSVDHPTLQAGVQYWLVVSTPNLLQTYFACRALSAGVEHMGRAGVTKQMGMDASLNAGPPAGLKA